MATKEPSTSAKILYRPVGLMSSVLGGLIAGVLFKQVWRRAAPGEKSDPPTALQTEYPFKQILLAAAIQGMIFSVVKTSFGVPRAARLPSFSIRISSANSAARFRSCVITTADAPAFLHRSRTSRNIIA